MTRSAGPASFPRPRRSTWKPLGVRINSLTQQLQATFVACTRGANRLSVLPPLVDLGLDGVEERLGLLMLSLRGIQLTLQRRPSLGVLLELGSQLFLAQGELLVALLRAVAPAGGVLLPCSCHGLRLVDLGDFCVDAAAAFGELLLGFGNLLGLLGEAASAFGESWQTSIDLQ